MEEDLQWMTTFDGRRPSLERFRDSALPYTAVAVIFPYGLESFPWQQGKSHDPLKFLVCTPSPQIHKFVCTPPKKRDPHS